MGDYRNSCWTAHRPNNALISGHSGGGEVTPGTYAGMARDLSILFNNLKPGMGGGGGFYCFALSQQNPREKTHRICKYL